jgi:hypothetical protein
MSCSTNCFALQKKIKDFNNNQVIFDKCSIGQSNIDQNMLNNDMAKQIRSMKAEIDDLQNKLDDLNDLNNGNSTMKDDFVNQYNYQYLQNACIFVGIIIIIICFFKLFQPDATTSSPNPVSAVTDNMVNGVSNAIK